MDIDTAVVNAWIKWPEIKDTVSDFGFGDWCKRTGGFIYERISDSGVIVTVLDEQKYAWFLLRWA